jgi:hypothetical protein
MLARFPLLNTFRLWAVLVAMVIGLQATVPVAPSLHKVDGSAFSASTYEVALYVQRADRSQRQPAALHPAATLGPITEAATAVAPILVGQPQTRPDSTGPPLHDMHSWRPAPRGPPQA